jgi:hypothetical protein
VAVAALALLGLPVQAELALELCLHLAPQGFLWVVVAAADMPVQAAALERVAEQPDKTRNKQLAAKGARKVALVQPALGVAALVLRAVAATEAMAPVIVGLQQPAEVVSESAVQACMTEEMPAQAVAVAATLAAAVAVAMLAAQAVAAVPDISIQVL